MPPDVLQRIREHIAEARRALDCPVRAPRRELEGLLWEWYQDDQDPLSYLEHEDLVRRTLGALNRVPR